mmetsp:Transcript_33734/g.94004  ORF Transcript_33734/g.94004 Transcript_33734/m.94004 type:complete len:211 (-) Transcript_33734:266-898(-)
MQRGRNPNVGGKGEVAMQGARGGPSSNRLLRTHIHDIPRAVQSLLQQRCPLLLAAEGGEEDIARGGPRDAPDILTHVDPLPGLPAPRRGQPLLLPDEDIATRGCGDHLAVAQVGPPSHVPGGRKLGGGGRAPHWGVGGRAVGGELPQRETDAAGNVPPRLLGLWSRPLLLLALAHGLDDVLPLPLIPAFAPTPDEDAVLAHGRELRAVHA